MDKTGKIVVSQHYPPHGRPAQAGLAGDPRDPHRQRDAPLAECAVTAARDFNLERAMTGYASLIDALLQASKLEGRP
jgi:hypothetical protein